MSGSEDATLRTWSPDGEPVGTAHTRDAVTAMCTDQETGYCVAASMDLCIRVYDLVNGEVITTHSGHTDAVRNIVHVPQKNEYLRSSHLLQKAWQKPFHQEQTSFSPSHFIIVP